MPAPPLTRKRRAALAERIRKTALVANATAEALAEAQFAAQQLANELARLAHELDHTHKD